MIFLRWDEVDDYLQNRLAGMTLSVMKLSILPEESTLRCRRESEDIERKLKKISRGKES